MSGYGVYQESGPLARRKKYNSSQMVAGKTRPDISKPTYVIVLWLSVSLVALAAGAGNPFGKDFQSLAVPALLLFGSLLWLLLSPKFGWKIAVTCVALAASLMLSVLSLFKAESAVAFVVAISAGIVVQLIVLSFLASDWKTTSIAIAQSFTVLFLILIGTHLRGSEAVPLKIRTYRLFFWVPLAAMAIWINAAISGWQKYSQILFIICLLQLCIGFFDMAVAQHATWMWVCMTSLLLAALGFVFGWAEQLNK